MLGTVAEASAGLLRRRVGPPTGYKGEVSETVERPSIGLFPKILVGLLAAFGLVMLVSWVLSWVMGLVKVAILIGVVVLVVAWVASRGGDE